MASARAFPLPFAERIGAPARADEAEWLAPLRRAGVVVYRQAGWPHAKIEAWKYTNLNRLAAVAFALAEDAPAPAALPAGRGVILEGAHRLVVVNGVLRPEFSDPPPAAAGVTVAPLARLAADSPEWLKASLGRVLDLEGMPLAALNAATWRDGVVVRVADGQHLERPLEIVSLAGAPTQPVMCAPRHLFVLGRDARATVVESYAGLDGAPAFTNVVTEVALAEDARLDHVKVVEERDDSFHLAATGVSLGARSRYEGFVLTLAGRLARSEVRARLLGAGGECRLAGAYLADGEAHADTTTLVDHAAAHTTSRQMFRGVLGGTARGVFQGKVLVRKHAQKTDGHQLHKALLLSRGAEVDAKPELEIYADDVKCGHGATVGQLDADQLFYLRARGLAEPLARRLLTEAFVAEALDEIADETVRAALGAAATRRLTQMTGA